MEFVEIAITCVGYLASAILAIYGFITKSKTKNQIDTANQTNDALSISVKRLEVLNKVSVFCDEAEKLIGDGNGQLKKLYVTLKVQSLANEMSVVITNEDIEKQIELVLTAPEKK